MTGKYFLKINMISETWFVVYSPMEGMVALDYP
jgi:hypothetical protein